MGLVNVPRAHANLVRIARSGITLELMLILCNRLAAMLPRMSDPDMALNNLERFVQATRSPLALGALIERDPQALPILLQMFSSSQHLSDVLIQEPEGFDLLRMTEGQPVARDLLVKEVCAEIRALADERDAMRRMRRIKRREFLRIAYGDFVLGQSVDTVTREISTLADALVEAALVSATQTLGRRYGTPRRADGQPARFVVLGLGKLGGYELNYSSDIDLMFLYDEEGRTDGEKTTENRDYFDRLSRRIVKLLSESTALGSVYRVDLRLRPEGSRGPVVTSRSSALHYYDLLGRTWERQAFVKARPIAGDLGFGDQFLAALEPWLYRRYLTGADIAGIKALKRKIEQRTRHSGVDRRDVKAGHGGIRDIEFVIQFLQLLNGGDLPVVRTGNTLEAIACLEKAGCLTMQERSVLEENYSFLRKVEHRLQIMFDLQTHLLPEDDEELRKLAIRMGFSDDSRSQALERFKLELQQVAATNRRILDHLLHDAFGEEGDPEPEVDLVLDPEPSAESIQNVLGPCGFRDVEAAYRNLLALSVENIRFLSTRRCRHFLAAIAPQLLQAISATPDPDVTLVNLSHVSDCLGGKGVLWELFSVNKPSLDLYVRLCAASPYLAEILTSHPGMIDELMDSLVVDALPTLPDLQTALRELCHGAEDLAPILHSFKNSLHLRVGVRDILGKEDIRATTATLSDVAEVCLEQMVLREYRRLVKKYGRPTYQKPAAGDQAALPDHAPAGDAPTAASSDSTSENQECELVILAMGKFGGREPNYHSDLDVIFLYEAEGMTQHHGRVRRGDTTTNQHFFSELGQRIIKGVNRLGPHGRLYELDPRLRPTGKSGALAVSVGEFAKYFAEGHGQLWERQGLCRARPIYGSPAARQTVMQAVHRAIIEPGWNPEDATSIREMRARLEETASKRNLKRGPGGTVDVEFAVQMLQLRHAATCPAVLVPGTFDALDALHDHGYLDKQDHRLLSDSYRFLRSVEARLRLMNTTARHDLPESESELAKLAYLLGCPNPRSLRDESLRVTTENRQRFQRLLDQASRA
jgi:glutamate-ammonia-ligase adenylyltransferase